MQLLNSSKSMGALVSYIVSLFPRSSCNKFSHALGLEFPQVIHKVVEDKEIRRFKEVFIIGDIHGCFDEMMELLQKAEVMDPSVLKIFVGDLVNKGPKSCQVAKTVHNMTSAMAVRGNHDEVVLNEYRKSRDSSYILSEKNQWIKNIPKSDIEFLSKLPYTITIPCLNTIIVHAGLVPGLPLHCHNPHDLITMRNIRFSDYFGGEGLQPTSKNDGEAWASLWQGPQHVYFGHDAKRMLQRYPYATGLDTGCVYGNFLTGIFIKGPRVGTIISVEAKKVYEKPKG